jgi:hypothetical protein
MRFCKAGLDWPPSAGGLGDFGATAYGGFLRELVAHLLALGAGRAAKKGLQLISSVGCVGYLEA